MTITERYRTVRIFSLAFVIASVFGGVSHAGKPGNEKPRFGTVRLDKERKLRFGFPDETATKKLRIGYFDIYSHDGIRYDGEDLQALTDWLRRRSKPTPIVVSTAANVSSPEIRRRVNDRMLIFVPRSEPRPVCAAKPSRKKPASQRSTAEAAVVRLVNVERARYGLRPLVSNTKLDAAARDHSQDMSRYRFFSHYSPIAGKSSFTQRARRFGATATAENIATGTTSATGVMRMWMGSYGHRAHILNPGSRTIGVGRSGGYWTMMFGR